MDDINGILVNAALVAALTPLLIGLGAMLKTLPPFRAAPEWVVPVNIVVGALLAAAYTWSRGTTAGTGPTAVEMTMALISGVMAGLGSAHIYDATRASLGHSAKARARRRPLPDAPPRG